jgi:hypothetical protein
MSYVLRHLKTGEYLKRPFARTTDIAEAQRFSNAGEAARYKRTQVRMPQNWTEDKADDE